MAASKDAQGAQAGRLSVTGTIAQHKGAIMIAQLKIGIGSSRRRWRGCGQVRAEPAVTGNSSARI